MRTAFDAGMLIQGSWSPAFRLVNRDGDAADETLYSNDVCRNPNRLVWNTHLKSGENS